MYQIMRPPPGRATAPARSRSPGPSRAARRTTPARGRRSRRVSASTCSTDADDRLPMRASESQVSRTASRGRLQRRLDGLDHLGPPGWQTQKPMSSRVRPWSARNSSTSSRRYRSTIVGHAASSTMRSPLRGDVAAHGALGVGVEPAARGQHVDCGPVSSRRSAPAITTAAAPSPNRPLATRLAIETSSRWKVSEHSSTQPGRRRRRDGPAGGRAPGRCRPRRRRSRARPAASA